MLISDVFFHEELFIVYCYCFWMACVLNKSRNLTERDREHLECRLTMIDTGTPFADILKTARSFTVNVIYE